jgi:hypothetical protein
MSRLRTRRRATVGLLAAAALLATTACGSTVQQTGGDALVGGGAAAPELGGEGLIVPGASAPDGATTGSGTEVLTGPGGTAASSGSNGTTGSTGSGSTTTGGRSTTPGARGSGPTTTGTTGGGADGPGVTAKTIALGITYCPDCAGTNAAVGGGGDDPGDTRRYMQAALDEVNARGGVLGRKLVPVFHEFSASDPLDVSAQAACETFTKDNKVLIMYFRGDLFYDCGRKAGTLVGALAGGTGPTYEKFPNVFAPSFVRLERLYDVTVKAMLRAGWQKPEPKWPTGKVGLVTWDTNEYRFAMKHGYLKAMGEAGLKDEDVRYVSVPQNANSIADASAAVSNTVLSFRDKGIDHVLIGDGPAGIFGGCGLTFLFLSNARSQLYSPRYGFNSNNCPDFENHPKDQLVGMLGIDAADTEAANDEGIAPNPVRERCYATMKKRGLPVTDDQTRNIAGLACEYAYFAEALGKRATNGTTLPSLIAAAESLGTSYRSPMSYGNRFGPRQHDGGALFRALRWEEGCQCNEYTSKPFEP